MMKTALVRREERTNDHRLAKEGDERASYRIIEILNNGWWFPLPDIYATEESANKALREMQR